MADTLKKVILTGDKEEIVALTDEEIAFLEESKLETAKHKAALAQAEAAKEKAIAKLAALGLTTDDLKALGL